MKIICCTFQTWRCITVLMALRRDTYWSSTVRFALVMYRSQTSDIRLCSTMQKTSVLFPTGGRIVIPSGHNHQNLSFVTTSFGWSSWIFLSYVWRYFSREMYKNFHSGVENRASSPWISRQYWWWASMWVVDKVSQVCWIWPKVCSGRSFSVLNRSSVIQRDLHRSYLSDSFFFVILWIQTLDGNVWEFVRIILLWSCDITEVNFIHSPNSSRPSPSRRNQSTVNVNVIGLFWCCMNSPSSLFLSRFLDSWITPRRVVSFVQMFLSSSISCPSSEIPPVPFLGFCSLRHFSVPYSYTR